MSKEIARQAFIAGWFGNNRARMEAHRGAALEPVERAFDGWYREYTANVPGTSPRVMIFDEAANIPRELFEGSFSRPAEPLLRIHKWNAPGFDTCEYCGLPRSTAGPYCSAPIVGKGE